MPASAPDALIAFVHCEKTAGSTLSGIIMAHYGRAAYVSVGSRKSREAAIAEMRRLAADRGAARVIRGHVPLGVMQRHLPENTRYFTLLRDPLERTLSHYFHVWTARGRLLPAGKAKLVPREREGLIEALRRPRILVDNLQTRMLCTDPRAWRRWREPIDRTTLEDAKRSLRDRLEVFGLVERFDDALDVILPILGVPRPKEYERIKVADHPRYSDLDEEERRAVEAHNQLDLELYEHAASLFESRDSR